MTTSRRIRLGAAPAAALALAAVLAPAQHVFAAPAKDAGASLDSLSTTYDNTSISGRLSVNSTTATNTNIGSGLGIGVAVLDSGVNDVPGLHGRIVQGADFTGQGGTDQFGHGTFVAGLIAGDGTGQDGRNTGIKGMAPQAKIISVKVADNTGRASVGSVVQGLAWVIANKARYNIKVVNLSLSVDAEDSYLSSPVDALVEAAWYDGITVVASSGNDGTAVTHAPGNDPLAITVGSTWDNNTVTTKDDTVSPYSDQGKTQDGFDKPEVTAPGEHVQSVVPQGSVLAKAMTVKGLPPGYGQLSGTSMSAGVVSGMVADLVGQLPLATPNQVKGMLAAARGTSRSVTTPGATSHLLAASANAGVRPSMLLAELYAQVVLRTTDYGSVDWSKIDWTKVDWSGLAATTATWTSATWTSATWTSATWTSATWTSSGDDDATWTSATWTSATWTSNDQSS